MRSWDKYCEDTEKAFDPLPPPSRIQTHVGIFYDDT